MKLFSRGAIIAGALATGLAIGQPAQAVSLIGAEIKGEWSFLLVTFDPPTFVVKAGSESTISVGPTPLFDVDFSADQLVLTVENSFAIGILGPVFTLLSGGPFDPLSSVVGLDPGRVSNTGIALSIDLAGLSVIAGNQIVITFARGAVVPLPAGLPLFATGLGVIGLFARNRRKSAADAARGLGD
jgi:hypothetical protein